MNGLLIKNKKIGIGRPLICVPVIERTKEKIMEEITYLSDSCADMIEWRIDTYEDFNNYNTIRDILDTIAPVLKEKLFLYTFRTIKQGGEVQIDRTVLDDLHDLAAENGCVDLLDLEYFEEEKPLKKIRQLQTAGTRVIASHHDFEETPPPEVMKMLLEQMCAGGADLVKLAVMPQNEKDVLNLMEVTEAFKRDNSQTPVITMAMGKTGCISRLCGETFGSCVTFAAHKKTSAPGQFEMKELNEILTIIHKSMENKM